MGCGASAEPIEPEGTTRFTNLALFNLNGLRFSNAPPPVCTTQGLHPNAKRLDEKKALHNIVRTNEGGVLVYASSSTAVDCLFLYPEYNAVADKTPTQQFGIPLLSQAPAAPEAPRPQPIAESNGATPGGSSGGGFFGSIKRAVAGAIDELTMEDADDDDESGRPPQKPSPSTNTSPAAASSAATRVQNNNHTGQPRWTAAVCQFKEFDSLDDVSKPWHRDAGGGVPGLLRLETAGAAGAWATLQPHRYQQRWALPNGDRVAGFTDDAPSIPQRILAAYRACGGDAYLRSLVQRVKTARASLSDDILAAAFDGAGGYVQDGGSEDAAAMERAREIDVDALVESLKAVMSDEGLGALGSVHQLPDSLNALKPVLGYIEDSLLYNWTEVIVDVEFEIGTHYFDVNDRSGGRKTEWFLRDTIMRKFIDKANNLTDDLLQALKDQLAVLSKIVLKNALDPDSGSAGISDDAMKQINALFPDLEDMVRMDAASIDGELSGIASSFDESPPSSASSSSRRSGGRNPYHVDFGGAANDARDEAANDLKRQVGNAAALGDMFSRWRREDSEPLEERRRRFYEAQTARLEKIATERAGSMKGMYAFGELTRRPLLLPKHFHTFNFILLFPRLADHPLSRRPSTARLCLWPDGFLELETTVTMTEFTIPHGGPIDENVVIEKATDLYDDGDDTIDTTDDPRVSWQTYATPDWRGFQCTTEVALGVNYGYNFLLDGVVFLDHNSWVHKSNGREYFRRMRFYQQARPFTFNPLAEVGLIVQ